MDTHEKEVAMASRLPGTVRWLGDAAWKLAVCLLGVMASVQGARGEPVIWSELNAGGTPGTAEEVAGPTNDLVRIQGTIDPLTDPVDLFRIRITNPGGFSARTTNGDSSDFDLEFDAVLALFDANGFGVYSNDDRVFDDGNAELPASHALSPTAGGLYLLAIYDDNFEALSAFSVDGVIFPESIFPYTAVRGPTGAGGADPLVGFGTLDDPPADPRVYTVELTGAAPVPESGPTLLQIAALGARLLLGMGRGSHRGTTPRISDIPISR
jgi:hypothetical protein